MPIKVTPKSSISYGRCTVLQWFFFFWKMKFVHPHQTNPACLSTQHQWYYQLDSVTQAQKKQETFSQLLLFVLYHKSDPVSIQLPTPETQNSCIYLQSQSILWCFLYYISVSFMTCNNYISWNHNFYEKRM